jgi:hypothetical protein
MYDLNSNNLNPIINFEGVSKNVTGLGFQVCIVFILLYNYFLIYNKYYYSLVLFIYFNYI